MVCQPQSWQAGTEAQKAHTATKCGPASPCSFAHPKSGKKRRWPKQQLKVWPQLVILWAQSCKESFGWSALQFSKFFTQKSTPIALRQLGVKSPRQERRPPNGRIPRDQHLSTADQRMCRQRHGFTLPLAHEKRCMNSSWAHGGGLADARQVGLQLGPSQSSRNSEARLRPRSCHALCRTCRSVVPLTPMRHSAGDPVTQCRTHDGANRAAGPPRCVATGNAERAAVMAPRSSSAHRCCCGVSGVRNKDPVHRKSERVRQRGVGSRQQHCPCLSLESHSGGGVRAPHAARLFGGDDRRTGRPFPTLRHPLSNPAGVPPVALTVACPVPPT